MFFCHISQLLLTLGAMFPLLVPSVKSSTLSPSNFTMTESSFLTSGRYTTQVDERLGDEKGTVRLNYSDENFLRAIALFIGILVVFCMIICLCAMYTCLCWIAQCPRMSIVRSFVRVIRSSNNRRSSRRLHTNHEKTRDGSTFDPPPSYEVILANKCDVEGELFDEDPPTYGEAIIYTETGVL